MDLDLPLPHLGKTVFRITDDDLQRKFHFEREVGFGNWGSVWLAQPRTRPNSSRADPLDRRQEPQVAIKLVHRKKKRDTDNDEPDDNATDEYSQSVKARVRALWNESKIFNFLQQELRHWHPSIVPFHSFIITPSYACITMSYVADPVPVEVSETYAKDWFKSLLSAVDFLHQRGIVHNDIKPANILVNDFGVPVLVDFGFALRYDEKSDEPFLSTLSYGTPEYLSPERARGQKHDSRKSDIWALGITFFEILTGRTPFEEHDSAQPTSKEELEQYWARTMRGKWIGSWKMSQACEKMLRRMLSPNADLRYTAADATLDQYWGNSTKHKRATSASPSVALDKEVSQILDALPPWSPSTSAKSNSILSQKAAKVKENRDPNNGHARSKSQPKIPVWKGRNANAKKRNPLLAPILGSPPTSPTSAVNKENVTSAPTNRRRPVSVRDLLMPLGGTDLNIPASRQSFIEKKSSRRMKSFAIDFCPPIVSSPPERKSVLPTVPTTAQDRVKAWQLDRDRLREVVAMEDNSRTTQSDSREEKEISVASIKAPVTPSSPDLPPSSTGHIDILSREFVAIGKKALEPAPNLIGATLAKRSLSSRADLQEEEVSRHSISIREDWEDDALIRDAKSSLPVCRQAVRNKRLAADNNTNRMTIWMDNVNHLVQDTKEKFIHPAADRPLPALPAPPLSRSSSSQRSHRSPRVPRKILAASEIFAGTRIQSIQDQSYSVYCTADDSTDIPISPSEKSSILSPVSAGLIPTVVVDSPPRLQRRATVDGSPATIKQRRIPATIKQRRISSNKLESPSRPSVDAQKRLQNQIMPWDELQRLVEEGAQQRPASPASSQPPTPKLQEVLDRRAFYSPALADRAARTAESFVSIPAAGDERSVDDLTSSPLRVDPYPPRATNITIMDSPSQRHLENVYDRFLMATAGVQRAGKGYCSNNTGPTSSAPEAAASRRKSIVNFRSVGRRHMPPAVSSEDLAKPNSVDDTEFTVVNSSEAKEESRSSFSFLRRALHVVAGKTPIPASSAPIAT